MNRPKFTIDLSNASPYSFSSSKPSSKEGSAKDLFKTNAFNDSKKKKKNLKLLLNSGEESDPGKSRILTPQHEINSLSQNYPLTCFSYMPSKKLDPRASIENDLTYKDDSYEIIMRKCGHSKQEDRFCARLLKKKDPFFGVFDGHGNSLSSGLLSEILYKYIENQSEYETDLSLAIKKAFKIFDEELLNLLHSSNIKGGSTALCAIFKNSKLYIMNCGDSISVLVGPQKMMKLNNEHTPKNEIERKNLDAKGAIVLEKKKILRVLGELAVSRSFGDKNYKDYITAEPEVLKFDIDEDYDYLVMATDGFWNVINLNHFFELYVKWLFSGEARESLGEFLISEAMNKDADFKKDNTTLIVVNLKKIHKMKEEYTFSEKDKKKPEMRHYFDFSITETEEALPTNDNKEDKLNFK